MQTVSLQEMSNPVFRKKKKKKKKDKYRQFVVCWISPVSVKDNLKNIDIPSKCMHLPCWDSLSKYLQRMVFQRNTKKKNFQLNT